MRIRTGLLVMMLTMATLVAVPQPSGAATGWRLVLAEDFTRDAPLGTLSARYPNMWAYPYAWTDTSRRGYYHPAKTLSVANYVLNSWLHYDTQLGRYLVSAFIPQVQPMKYGRFTVRLRADNIPGYKIAPLLWPDSEAWPRDGEIDFPEGDLNGEPPLAFMHYASSKGGQDVFHQTHHLANWHTYDIRWTPGRVEFRVDSEVVGVSTTRVPFNPMHWVLQFETTGSTAPPKTAQGNVQVDWLNVYAMTP